jgi:hypothetical protein
MSSKPRILITRMPPYRPHHYDIVLEFIARNHRELAPLFDIQQVGARLGPDSEIRCHVPWLQDPLGDFNVPAYQKALELESDCLARGIPVVNRVSRHHHAKKAEASQRMLAAGIKTARTVAIDDEAFFRDALCGLNPPVLLRDDSLHRGELQLIESVQQARDAPLELYKNPSLTEFIDVQSPDGLYRKYRCIVVGDTTIPQHLQISDTPVTRSTSDVKNLQSREEEIEFISKPFERPEVMQQVRRALEVDFGGIDFGIDRQGEIVVWELNQFPHLPMSQFDKKYRNFAQERCYAAMVLYYLQLAGEPVPAKLERQAGFDD